MNMDDALLRELSYLTLLSKEGKVNDEQMSRLEGLLRENKVARQYYIGLINTDLSLRYPDISDSLSNQQPYSISELYELLEYEKTAPVIEILREQQNHEFPQNVIHSPGVKRKLNKLTVFALINAAAILLIVLLLSVMYNPLKVSTVATLTDSVNATWTNSSGPMERGTRLAVSGEKMFLKEGLAELFFDNNAKVVIEGPAEFALLAEDQIELQYGRLYATVPQEASGFSINTPTSRIIDLGTEFGVDANRGGDVYLHVIKGKTKLIVDDESMGVNLLEVDQGQAKRVSGQTLNISNIPCETGVFVRDISSDKNRIWISEDPVSLADLRAGNIFYTNSDGIEINPATGKQVVHGNISSVYQPIGVKQTVTEPILRVGKEKKKDIPMVKLDGTARRTGNGSFYLPDGEPWGCVQVGDGVLEDLRGLRSFTIMGWLRPESLRVGSGGNRILFCLKEKESGIDLVHHKDGRLRLSVNEWPDNVWNDSSPGKLQLDKWTFFAVSYDSTVSGDNVSWYFSDSLEAPGGRSAVTLDCRNSYHAGPVDSDVGPLAIGNFNETMRHYGLDRQFRGEIRDLKVFGSPVNGLGALNPDEISIQSGMKVMTEVSTD